MEKVSIDQSVFQNLLENIPGMLYRCKFQPSWPILYISKGSLDLTGYSPAELTSGKIDFASLIHPDDREWVWEHFTRQLSRKENCNCEYRILSKCGKQKWVREIASGVFNDDGDLLYIEGYIIDISEKKEHHRIIATLESHVATINTNERRLRALLNAIPDTLIRINSQGQCFVYSSEAGSVLHPSDREGRLNAFFPADIAALFLKNALNAIHTAKRLTFGYELKVDDEVVYYEARMVKSGDDEVISIVRDVSEMVKATQEVDRTSRFYKEIIDHSNSEIAVFDWDNRYRYVSRAGIIDAQVREWIIGKNDFDYCRFRNKPDTIAQYRARMFDLVKSMNHPADWIEEMENNDGSFRYMVRNLRPFKFDDEHYLLGHSMDITALKVIQNELQRRDQLLASSQEIAKIAYWVWYSNTEVFEWSSSIYAILDIEPDTLEASLANYLSFVHSDDRPLVEASVHAAIHHHDPFSIAYRIVTRSGQLKFVKEQSYGDFKESTSGKYVFGLIQDVTEFYLSTKALEKREDHFRAIAENSPGLIVEVDRDLTIRYINTLKVRKSEDVLGLSVFYFTHNDYKELFREKLAACFATGEMQRLQIMGQGAYSRDEWYEITIGPVKDKDNHIETLILLAQNITRNKKNEKDREKLIQEVNHRYNELMQFNYIVSHNLRAPVANILGMSYLLNIGLPEEETRQVVQDLVKSAESIDALLKDLNYILAARSPLNEKKERFGLQEVVQTVQYDLEKQIKESFAHLDTSQLRTLEVNSIKSYIQSILHHLVSNAIKYKHPQRSPEISISSYSDEDYTFIEIADNGIGIDLNLYRDEVFGLYKRFTNTVAGKGLGLHMVKAQVESLGGTIDIQSSLHIGTCFKIRLNNT